MNREQITRRLKVAAGVACLLLMAAASTNSEGVETRTFTRTGSRGVTSDVEFYVVGGTYEHRLETTHDCFASAGVFPAGRLPRVTLREVLSADISAGNPTSSNHSITSSDTFVITSPGWAVLQVGTGPSCSWTYSISGVFLPSGDEPGPPGASTLQWWEGILLLVIILTGVALFVRRGPSTSRTDAEEKVRVLPSHSDSG